jgi:hypothetical protein
MLLQSGEYELRLSRPFSSLATIRYSHRPQHRRHTDPEDLLEGLLEHPQSRYLRRKARQHVQRRSSKLASLLAVDRSVISPSPSVFRALQDMDRSTVNPDMERIYVLANHMNGNTPTYHFGHPDGIEAAQPYGTASCEYVSSIAGILPDAHDAYEHCGVLQGTEAPSEDYGNTDFDSFVQWLDKPMEEPPSSWTADNTPTSAVNELLDDRSLPGDNPTLVEHLQPSSHANTQSIVHADTHGYGSDRNLTPALSAFNPQADSLSPPPYRGDLYADHRADVSRGTDPTVSGTESNDVFGNAQQYRPLAPSEHGLLTTEYGPTRVIKEQ